MSSTTNLPISGAALSIYNANANQLCVHALALDRTSFLAEGLVLPEATPGGKAFATQKTEIVDCLTFDEFPSEIVRNAIEAGTRSVLSAPLTFQNRQLGVLSIASLNEAAFSADDAELFTEICNQIAIAVDNALYFQRAKQARDRFEMLLKVSNAVSSTLNFRDLLKATSAILRQYIKHDMAGMALYEEDTKMFRILSLDFAAKDFLGEGSLFSLTGTPDELAFKTKKIVLRERIDLNEFPSPQVKMGVEAGLKSGCVVPLISRNKVIGTLAIASKREASLTKDDGEILQLIANQIASAVENALQFAEIEKLKNKLADEKLYLEEEIQSEYNFAEIVRQSSSLKEVLRQVETVAPTDSCVLICGETGTGKELIARAIHNLSNRRERTMFKLNCSAIPTGLLESELFGHEKGAFTRAIAQRIGRFELANKGTLLLDEIGDIPLELQPKLLRVLQENEFERLGSSRTMRVDVRLIAATNCDLRAMVEEKKFRSDLYYRLNVFPITLPPLRERREDIPLLAGYFTQKHARRMNKRIESISKETINALSRYDYPGNVRELENFVERAVILTTGNELQVQLAELKINQSIDANTETASESASRLSSLEDVERAHIEEILQKTQGGDIQSKPQS